MSSTDIVIVGLSGKYCAGKSTVGDWLASRGALNIEADHLGHQAINDCQDQIVSRFGNAILADGKIDRKALGRAVFGNPVALADLEAIVHPAVLTRIDELIAERRRLVVSAQAVSGSEPRNQYFRIVVVNAALLFKSGLDSLCDIIFWIDSPVILRFWRGFRRDKRGFWSTLALMNSQKSLGPQHRSADADIIRVSNLCRQRARTRVGKILERYNG